MAMKFLLQYAYDDEPSQWKTFSFYENMDRAVVEYQNRRDYDRDHDVVRKWRVEFKSPTGTIAEMLEFKKDWNTRIWNEQD